MKSFTRLMLLILLTGSAASLRLTAAEADPVPYPETINVPHALVRGTVNFLTAWLEIPRRTVLAVNESPVFGMLTGPMEGVFFSAARIVLSAADYAMLGFTGPSAYEPVDFPEYVWNAQWNPYPEEPAAPVALKPAPTDQPQHKAEEPTQLITPPDELF